jgi:hypothetical protein
MVENCPQLTAFLSQMVLTCYYSLSKGKLDIDRLADIRANLSYTKK